MAEAWKSYDSVAATHDRLCVPSAFAQPAKDLAAKMDFRVAERVLDVGTGTGIAGLLAKELASKEIMVAGLDPSIEMLRIARSHGLLYVVAGAVPGLPFAAGTFDRVVGSFVLAHFADYKSALVDMARVVGRGGRLGVTAWGRLQDHYRKRWQFIAESFAGEKALGLAMQEALPWEDWFAEPDHLRQAFEGAGLIRHELHHFAYTIRISITDFLATRETSLAGRFMRQTLDPNHWEQFRQAVSTEFYKTFTDPIEYVRDVHIAIGTRP